MNPEEFEIALQNLLMMNPTPIKPKRNRLWRQHHKYRVEDKFMKNTYHKGLSIYGAKWVELEVDYDTPGGWKNRFIIPTTLHHSGARIKHHNPSRGYQLHKRCRTKRFRQYKGDTVDGCFYKYAREYGIW